ncbi:MAG: type II toxin-antitoxin system PemK/MazF family toxin [Nocardioides sp.]
MGVVGRGDVWWVDFGEPVGSEPGFRRPALVVASDRFNRSRIATTIVSAITSNLRLAAAPGNVELATGHADLAKPSVVNVSQTMVVDRVRLLDRSGSLGSTTMRLVDDGLRLVLGL